MAQRGRLSRSVVVFPRENLKICEVRNAQDDGGIEEETEDSGGRE